MALSASLQRLLVASIAAVLLFVPPCGAQSRTREQVIQDIERLTAQRQQVMERLRQNNIELLTRCLATVEALSESVQVGAGDFAEVPELVGKGKDVVASRNAGDPQWPAKADAFMRDLFQFFGRKVVEAMKPIVDEFGTIGEGLIAIGKAAKAYASTKEYQANHNTMIRELANIRTRLDNLYGEYRTAPPSGNTATGPKKPPVKPLQPRKPDPDLRPFDDSAYAVLDEAIDILEVRDKGYRAFNGNREKLAALFRKHPGLKREVEEQFGPAPESTTKPRSRAECDKEWDACFSAAMRIFVNDTSLSSIQQTECEVAKARCLGETPNPRDLQWLAHAKAMRQCNEVSDRCWTSCGKIPDTTEGQMRWNSCTGRCLSQRDACYAAAPPLPD